jgi:hypothetical protein
VSRVEVGRVEVGRVEAGRPDRSVASSPGSVLRRRLGLAWLGAYGVVTAVTGLLLAVGSGSSASGSRAAVPLPVAARPVVLAPVLPARPVASALGPAAGPEALPSAKVARGTDVGSPFQPAQLVLPGGSTAPIRAAGLHPDGSLVIPDDPAVVGWWTGGARAGDAFGSVVVAGHVDSAQFGLGMMSQLRKLKTGQVVELRAGGRRLGYRITTRTSLPQAELAARTDAFRQDVSPRLVLITCGGAFDPMRHRYQDNLLIYAQPVPLSPGGATRL